MRKLSRISLPLLVSLVSSACSSVPIKDIPLYWPVGPDGAVITHTLTDEEGRMGKPEWEEFSRSTVCQTYDDFAWLRGTIEKLCSEHKRLCKVEVQERIAAISRRTRATAVKLKRGG